MHRPPARLLWLAALVLALGFLAVDSGHRLSSTSAVTMLRPGEAPAPLPDPSSPTGFEAGQHRLILPTAGADGYHWILQTERLLAGDGLRIRGTTVDNAPQGREVHWSSLPRWWLATVALARGASRPGLTAPQALEQVAAGAGALALALILLAVTPLLAWRLGPVPASLFALAWVAVFPLYETFMAGIVDHHGFLAMSAFGSVILLVVGGAGWVREAGGAGGHGLPLPDERSARRWFMAAGVAGGIGLWISAVTMVPLLVATAAGAVLAAGAPAGAGRLPDGEERFGGSVRPAPELWRLWGVAGFATSLAAYAIEYAPGHLGMRLEVNHPLHALAWLAAGDLLTRVCRILSRPARLPEGSVSNRRREWPAIAGGLLLAGAPAAAILAAGEATFRLADPFLRALHLDYIREFQGLSTHLGGLSGLHVLQSVSVLPLVLLPTAAVICRMRGDRPRDRSWQTLAGGMAVAGVAFFHAASHTSVGWVLAAARLMPLDPTHAALATHMAGLVLDGTAFGLLFLWPLRGTALPRPVDSARLALAAVPAAALLAITFWQVRWLTTASTALLALLVTAAALGNFGAEAWKGLRRALPAGMILFLLAPFPVTTALFPWRFGYPSAEEAPQVVARDVAHRLRARVGHRAVVVAAPPVTTTWLIYFGGFRGLGTLYWENVEGLKATAAILSASDEAEARGLMDRHGVTHLMVPSWEPWALLVPSLPREGDPGGSAGAPRGPVETFLARLVASDSVPDWLVPIPYEVPDLSALRETTVRLYEVGPGMPVMRR